MGGLHCFGIDSYLRLLGKRWGVFWLIPTLASTTAQILPIEAWKKALAAQNAPAFTLQMDAQLYAELLLCGDRFSQVSHAGFATCSERLALSGREASQVVQDLLHWRILLHGNTKANTLRCFTWE